MKKTLILFIILLICIITFYIYKSNIVKQIAHNDSNNEQKNLDNSYNIFPADIKYEDLSKENKELIIKISRLKNLTNDFLEPMH